LAAVAVLLIVIFALGGSSSPRKGTSSIAGAPSAGKHAASHSKRSATAAGAGANHATSVTVLNGTETSGLAHHIAALLHQSGFTRAVATSGRPPGANQRTVVEYASGHRSDAQAVARALGAGQPQPIEATVSSLGGSASVVVVVGLDKAAAGP
jgi:hypothetical protein